LSGENSSQGRITELKSEIQSLIGILETQRSNVQGGDDAGIGASVQQLLSQMSQMKNNDSGYGDNKGSSSWDKGWSVNKGGYEDNKGGYGGQSWDKSGGYGGYGGGFQRGGYTEGYNSKGSGGNPNAKNPNYYGGKPPTNPPAKGYGKNAYGYDQYGGNGKNAYGYDGYGPGYDSGYNNRGSAGPPGVGANEYIDFRQLLRPPYDTRTTIIIRNIPNKMSRKAILNTFLMPDNVSAAVDYLRRNPDKQITEEILDKNCHSSVFMETLCGQWNKNYNNTYNIDQIATINVNEIAGVKLHPNVRELIDWFHIPLQSKRAINKGYAFINFREPRYIPVYVYALTGLKFPGYRTNKCIAIEFSSKQIRAKSQYSEKRHVDHEGPIFLDHFAPADLESILIPPGKTSGYFPMAGMPGQPGPGAGMPGSY